MLRSNDATSDAAFSSAIIYGIVRKHASSTRSMSQFRSTQPSRRQFLAFAGGGLEMLAIAARGSQAPRIVLPGGTEKHANLYGLVRTKSRASNKLLSHTLALAGAFFFPSSHRRRTCFAARWDACYPPVTFRRCENWKSNMNNDLLLLSRADNFTDLFTTLPAAEGHI